MRWLLRAGVGRGELRLGDLNRPELGCGLVVLGMGKLGANELNYSSDIDLIALYDGEAAPYVGQRTAQEFYIRLVRDLVKMLQQPTRNGHVLRTGPIPASRRWWWQWWRRSNITKTWDKTGNGPR